MYQINLNINDIIYQINMNISDYFNDNFRIINSKTLMEPTPYCIFNTPSLL